MSNAEENDRRETNPREVAEWMASEVRRTGHLSQRVAVHQIREHFGPSLLYKNKNHNWAIAESVLRIFSRLTKNDVVWSFSSQFWRLRRPTDPLDQRVFDRRKRAAPRQ